jgi:RimJ/RimL family protein N-acetyltransferase
VVRNLGFHRDVTQEQLAMQLTELSGDKPAREAMTMRGRQLVDGHGAARVLEELGLLSIRFRPATTDDCRRLWLWANDPIVRAASFSSATILWSEHQQWFTDRLNDPSCDLFMVCGDCEEPLGQVRFDVSGNHAVISICIAPEFRGRRLASQIIGQATRKLFDRRVDVNSVIALIRPENTASCRAFFRAGFVSADDTLVRGQPSRRMVLNR